MSIREFPQIRLDPEEGLWPVCVRMLHHPELSHGFVCSALGSCLFHVHKCTKTGLFKADRVIKFSSVSLPPANVRHSFVITKVHTGVRGLPIGLGRRLPGGARLPHRHGHLHGRPVFVRVRRLPRLCRPNEHFRSVQAVHDPKSCLHSLAENHKICLFIRYFSAEFFTDVWVWLGSAKCQRTAGSQWWVKWNMEWKCLSSVSLIWSA
jgi:hypothetical protein